MSLRLLVCAAIVSLGLSMQVSAQSDLHQRRDSLKLELQKMHDNFLDIYDTINYKKVSIDDMELSIFQNNSSNDNYDVCQFAFYNGTFEGLRSVVTNPSEANYVMSNFMDYEFDSVNYLLKDYAPAAKVVYAKRKGDCEDGATFFNALLIEDGLKPYIAVLHSNDESTSHHALTIYKTRNGYSSSGINKGDIHYNLPTVKKLIKELSGDWKLGALYYPITQKFISGEGNIHIFSPYLDSVNHLSAEINRLNKQLEN